MVESQLLSWTHETTQQWTDRKQTISEEAGEQSLDITVRYGEIVTFLGGETWPQLDAYVVFRLLNM